MMPDIVGVPKENVERRKRRPPAHFAGGDCLEQAATRNQEIVIPYEFIERGGGVLTAWAADERERRAIKHHIRLVLLHERNMAYGSLYFPVDESERKTGIYYAKIKANRQLRPRLCLGPQNSDEELTYLARAIERDNKITPADATDVAFNRRQEIAASPERRQRITSGRTRRI